MAKVTVVFLNGSIGNGYFTAASAPTAGWKEQNSFVNKQNGFVNVIFFTVEKDRHVRSGANNWVL